MGSNFLKTVIFSLEFGDGGYTDKIWPFNKVRPIFDGIYDVIKMPKNEEERGS